MKSVIDIQNKITTYENNAEAVRRFLATFDYTTIDTILAPLKPVFNYGVFKELRSNPVDSLASYEKLAQRLNKMSALFFGEQCQNNLEALENNVEFCKSVKGYEYLINGWTPSNASLTVADSILNVAREICVIGKDRFAAFVNNYLTEVFARWLPNATAEEARVLVNKNYINEQTLNTYIDLGYVKPNDISGLFTELGVNAPETVSYTDLKIKGCTYNTSTGESRQSLLASLKVTDSAVVTLKPYTYTPQNGEPEPAVAVMWDGKDVGTLDKGVVQQLFEKYESPKFDVKGFEVIGGYNSSASFGMKISFDVTGKMKEENANANNVATEYNPLNV